MISVLVELITQREASFRPEGDICERQLTAIAPLYTFASDTDTLPESAHRLK